MRIIKVNENNKIIEVKNVLDAYVSNPGLQYGEEISDIGEFGQLKQSDGTFIDDPQDEIDRQNALKEQRRRELIQFMIEANALRDDAAWATYKAEYDALV
ncbi:MAG: hypothetical protein ACOZCL_08420 [Bacillota bacterium]